MEELLAELQRLRAENEALRVRDAERQIVVENLLKRVAELEKQLGLGGAPSAKPPFVKANTPKKDPTNKRKKRNLQFCRRRESPTRTLHHAADACPDCGHKLSGGSVYRTRQIIEIEPSPVEITDHVIHRRYCGYCKKQVLPNVDFSKMAVGKRRIGLNLTSWIATLHIEARIPIRMIQRLLHSLFKVHVAIGEIVDLLDAVAEKAKPVAQKLLEEVRGSPYVHGDETGWREGGQSGQLWSFSTPSVRYYHRDPSRGHQVAQDLLGENFEAILVTDFYSAYNCLPCKHQRCWVHFARDLHKLREAGGELLNGWVDAVLDVWRRAKEYQARCLSRKYFDTASFDRQRYRKRFEQELYALAEPYLDAEDAPNKTLANRIALFLSELFTFVEYPEVPSDNNPAERAIRPAVIARKVRGGTRSQKGSKTWDTLMTVIATWRLRNLDPAAQCANLLRQTA